MVNKRVYLIGGRYWDVAEDDYIFLNDIHVLDTRAPRRTPRSHAPAASAVSAPPPVMCGSLSLSLR